VRKLICLFAACLLVGCAHDRNDWKPSPEGRWISGVLLSETNSPAGSIYVTKIYVVAKGDTFVAIARRFDVSLQELHRLNPKLKTNMLLVGQRIRVAEQKVE
jgi:hypothetical protein